MFRKSKDQKHRDGGLFRLGSKLSAMLYQAIHSYWFIPLVMVISSLVLSVLTTLFDTYIFPQLKVENDWLFTNSAEGARQVLSTIAGSMITVAGVTFSLTTIAVSNAAISFGPRLVNNFLGYRSNQITLGTFIATYIYCLMIMRSIHGATEEANSEVYQFIPSLSLLVGVILAIVSVFWLIYFIHHVPESINISNIVARVGKELEESLAVIGERQSEDQPLSLNETTMLSALALKARAAPSPKSGYVQALDFNKLIATASKEDFVVWLQAYPGKFVAEGEPFLFYASSRDWEGLSNDKLSQLVSVGNERTSHQDINFLLDELLEILIKALSPGISDPYTAQTSLDWIRVFLLRLSKIESSERFLRGEDDKLRVICPDENFEFFLKYICERSFSYIVQDNNTSIHLVRCLGNLGLAIDPKMQEAVKRSLEVFSALLEDQNPIKVQSYKDLIKGISLYPRTLTQNAEGVILETNDGYFKRLQDLTY